MVSKRPKGTSALFGSTTPASRFIVASKARKSAIRSVRTGAVTMKCPCVITFRAGRCGGLGMELQREVDQPRLVPIDLAQIDVGGDQPDLVADPLRHDGGLRVIQHDAFLAVEPARRLVDLGDDGVDAEGQNAV